MALVVADRVKETTTTTGTAYLLPGVSGFESFSVEQGTTYCCCTDSRTLRWVSVRTPPGTTLARTASVCLMTTVDWSYAGYFCTQPAEKAVSLMRWRSYTYWCQLQCRLGQVTSALEFADNAVAAFGAGDDLKIYHDGSNSYEDGTGTVIKSTLQTSLVQVLRQPLSGNAVALLQQCRENGDDSRWRKYRQQMLVK